MVAAAWASLEEQHGGTTYHETSKPVEIPIYKKYAIPIPHPVPIPIPQQIKVPIPQPYQVPVAIPHPVPVEVVKHIEIPVEKPEPYVVEKKVCVPGLCSRACARELKKSREESRDCLYITVTFAIETINC